MITILYTEWKKAKSGIFEDFKHGRDLIKWVLKAVAKDDARPQLQVVKIENISDPDWDYDKGAVKAELISTDGFRIHHAVITLPVSKEALTEGTYKVTFHGTDMVQLEKVEGLNFPDWKAVVDYSLFTPEKENCAKPVYFNPSFLTDAFPPLFGEEYKGVTIRTKDSRSPAVIYSHGNTDNFCILMPIIKD